MSGVGVQEMATHLRVDRNTVSNWINGRANPRDRDLRDFALRTGFPAEWLETGVLPTDDDGVPVQLSTKITNRLLAAETWLALADAA